MPDMKTGYVEQFINARQQQVWDAYLSVDVSPFYGWERSCPELQQRKCRTTPYDRVKDYLEQLNASEAQITERDVTVDKYVIDAILESIIGKNIQVHVKVQEERISEVNNILFQQASVEAADDICFLRWLYSHDDYVLTLIKRLTYWNEYYLRLYDGGEGVIVYCGKDKLATHYFRLENDLWMRVRSIAEKVIVPIVTHQIQPPMIDDRCYIPIHLQYGLTWIYPHAYDNMGSGDRYEDTVYPNDENDVPIIKLLMTSDEVHSKWLHMHDQ